MEHTRSETHKEWNTQEWNTQEWKTQEWDTQGVEHTRRGTDTGWDTHGVGHTQSGMHTDWDIRVGLSRSGTHTEGIHSK